jgi:hypothetical protein
MRFLLLNLKSNILFCIALLTVSCTTQQQLSYIPFKTFYSQPPGNPKNWKQAIQLEDIDGSGVFVYTNGNYWYSGPRVMNTKGWVPISNGRPGWYPLPGEVFVQRYFLVGPVRGCKIY